MNHLLPLDWTRFVPKTTCECSLRSRRYYHFKNFFRNKAVSDGAISFYLDHFVRTRVSKVTYGVFGGILYNSSDRDHRSRSHKAYTSASGNKRIESFHIILPRVSCLIPFLKSMLFESLLFVEYASFGDEGIQKIIFIAFRFCTFPRLQYFHLVLPWKRRDSHVGRRWYEWETSHNHLFSVLNELILYR